MKKIGLLLSVCCLSMSVFAKHVVTLDNQTHQLLEIQSSDVGFVTTYVTPQEPTAIPMADDDERHDIIVLTSTTFLGELFGLTKPCVCVIHLEKNAAHDFQVQVDNIENKMSTYICSVIQEGHGVRIAEVSSATPIEKRA